MAMKKRGVSTLFLVILAIVIIVVAGIVYYYTTKEKVILTPEEQKTAKSLDLTPKEFKEVSTKAEEVFKKDLFLYEEGALAYSKIDGMAFEEFKGSKPSSKIIKVRYTLELPSPYIIYSVKNGEVEILKAELEPEGL